MLADATVDRALSAASPDLDLPKDGVSPRFELRASVTRWQPGIEQRHHPSGEIVEAIDPEDDGGALPRTAAGQLSDRARPAKGTLQRLATGPVVDREVHDEREPSCAGPEVPVSGDETRRCCRMHVTTPSARSSGDGRGPAREPGLSTRPSSRGLGRSPIDLGARAPRPRASGTSARRPAAWHPRGGSAA